MVSDIATLEPLAGCVELVGKKFRSSLLFWAAVILTLLCPAQIPAQDAPTANPVVILSKLSPPIYPPIAKLARVSGDVQITLKVRQDGSVESAEFVSGPPLLKAAALESAHQSKFECHGCEGHLVEYSMLYTFGYTTTIDCCKLLEEGQGAESRVKITESEHHITILTEPACLCDPAADVVKVRSAKCLFLWHCGTRYGL